VARDRDEPGQRTHTTACRSGASPLTRSPGGNHRWPQDRRAAGLAAAPGRAGLAARSPDTARSESIHTLRIVRARCVSSPGLHSCRVPCYHPNPAQCPCHPAYSDCYWPSMTGGISHVWMTEWVRLREIRKREMGLKKQAADARLRQRAEAQRLELEKREREYEEANRPYKVRAQALTKLLEDASLMIKVNLNIDSYAPGVRQAWKIQASTVLQDILGEYHSLMDEIDTLWNYTEPESGSTQDRWEKEHWRLAEGIMKAAMASYTFMNTKIQDSTIANTLDPDLMARIDHVFRVEDWTAVASLAATFVEDRFRIWAGLDQSAFGVNLMTKVLHPDTGVFPLGTAAPEREGWHQLGRGFVSSCSNVDRHRIQSRDDLRRYAVGVTWYRQLAAHANALSAWQSL
jgi:Protein of unknown function (Hypoth_ymh)